MGALRWRVGGVVVLFLLSLWLSLPTFLREPPDFLLPLLLKNRMRLGLDLQGGTHLVLSVDLEEATKTHLIYLENRLKKFQEEEKISRFSVVRFPERYTLEVTLEASSGSSLEKFLEEFRDQVEFQTVAQSSEEKVYAITLRDGEIRRLKSSVMEQAMETIRNRIDQFGVVEPSIQRQGENRIAIQLPGIQDPQRAIALIGKTAQLTFHLYRDDLYTSSLQDQVSKALEEHPEWRRDIEGLNQAFSATLPVGTVLRLERNRGGGRFQVPALIDKDPLLTGDMVADARVRIDPTYNTPYVAIEFTREGGKVFADVTGKYVKRRLAIVLDETIYSAPVIQEKIVGGSAQITGIFSMEEAKDLAIVLRSGALPAPVKVEEQRVVGPNLGQDMIRRGVLASLLGAFLVALVMVIYYRYGGFSAVVSVVINILMMLGILSLFEGTLTLPGIAGIALTIGMAVDGNIIIYERIREDLRAGRSVRSALESGFSQARRTVLDANLTTLIAGIVLFQFGTGPIRGFALTLSLGIFTTLVTVLFVTKVLLDLPLSRKGTKGFSI
jgi:preprotein translocase subunit SecD